MKSVASFAGSLLACIVIFTGFVSAPASAKAKPYKCWQCKAGTSYHWNMYLLVYTSKQGCIDANLDLCKSDIKKKFPGKDPNECRILETRKVGCPPEERPDHYPFCNYTRECREGQACVSGICQNKNDPANNTCKVDSDCGMDGKCHAFGYCI